MSIRLSSLNHGLSKPGGITDGMGATATLKQSITSRAL
jgi:hypothetical protein